jgi:hypothetical protein
MISRIEPDRYADTGFAVRDTPPEINDMIFRAMMQRTEGERLLMGLEMMAAAKALVRASLPPGTEVEQRTAFLAQFYGDSEAG